MIKNNFNNKNSGSYYSVPVDYLNKMTLEQMDLLKSKSSKAGSCDNFKRTYFAKTYHYYFEDPEYYQCATIKEKRDLFIKILKQYKVDQSLRTSLIREILEYGILLDDYNKNHFIEYLKYPKNSSYLNYKNFEKFLGFKGKQNCQGDGWSYLFRNIKAAKFNDYDLYRRILEHYYKMGEGWKDFEIYFDKDFLRRFKTECDFLAGKRLSDKELQELPHGLRKETLIDLPDINQYNFKTGERVKLIVDLKNVSSLYIKVFEFNTLNYFKKTKNAFKTDVNLDGLIASKELTYEFTESPQIKHRNEFEFSYLDNKVGIFIIELIANGYSSRATIKVRITNFKFD